jgi:hypothetical protein
MENPGVWVLGDLADDDRGHGMGIVVEYAGHGGKPQWTAPKAFRWNYLRFGKTEMAPEPDEIIDMTFAKRNAADHGFNAWSINGAVFSMDGSPSTGAPLPNSNAQRQRRHPPDSPSPAQF